MKKLFEFTPENTKRMLVSGCGEIWHNRIYLYQNGGRYFCVSSDSEKKFNKKEYFHFITWKYIKPIPTKRPYKYEDFIGKPWMTWIVRPKANKNVSLTIASINSLGIFFGGKNKEYKYLPFYEFSKDYGITWEEFEVEE